MARVYIRAEWKGGENDKENLIEQVERVNYLAQELSKAVRDLNFSAVQLKIEDAPSEGKSDEANESTITPFQAYQSLVADRQAAQQANHGKDEESQ